MAKFSDTHFVLQNGTNPQNKFFGVQETCTEMCRTVDVWITVGFPTLFAEV